MTTSNESRPVLQTSGGTGTEWGFGYWASWTECPKKARFDSQREKSAGLSGSFGRDVGTVVHAYLEMFYRAAMEDRTDKLPTLIEFTDPSELPEDYKQKVYKEADRVFNGYREAHTPDEFTEILAVEELIELRNWLHFPVFTLRPDMVIRCDEDNACALGLVPGVYTVDFKNWGRHGAMDALYCEYDMRFQVYTAAYKETFPTDYRGNLTFANYKTKELDFQRFVLNVEDVDMKRVIEFSSQAVEARGRNLETPIGNPLKCLDWTRNSKCPYFLTSCKGI